MNEKLKNRLLVNERAKIQLCEVYNSHLKSKHKEREERKGKEREKESEGKKERGRKKERSWRDRRGKKGERREKRYIR